MQSARSPEHREQLDALAGALLERETLDETDTYAAAGIPSPSHPPPVIATGDEPATADARTTPRDRPSQHQPIK